MLAVQRLPFVDPGEPVVVPLDPVVVTPDVFVEDSSRVLTTRVVEERNEGSGVNEAENPKRQKTDITIDSGLNLEDSWVGENLPQVVRDVVRVVVNQNFGFRMGDNEN